MKYYSRDHLWVKLDGDKALIGLTRHALEKMKAVVFVNLPSDGDSISSGEPFGDIESLKTVSDLISPIDGTVAEVNEEVIDSPELLYESEDCWLIAADISGMADGLMEQSAYENFISGSES